LQKRSVSSCQVVENASIPYPNWYDFRLLLVPGQQFCILNCVVDGNLQHGALERLAKVEEFQRKHRVELLTLLFTDIVDSTRLKQTLGDREAVTVIQSHHAVIRETLSQFSEGEEISVAGDSFFIVFTRPSDAVKFSLLTQARLRAFSAEVGRPVCDRIGIHVGEVWVGDERGAGKARDLYGLQVDTCARVQSLGQGDQILLTRFPFDAARQALRGEELEQLESLSWLSHGPYLMKGVHRRLVGQDPTNAAWQGAAASNRYCLARILLRLKQGNRDEAERLVLEGLDIMTHLESESSIDAKARDTLNKLKEIATALGR